MKTKDSFVASGNCTQRELAEKLGISRVTVHRALNDHPSVKPAVRQRILETANRLGYRRNDLARAMVTGKSRVIGLLAMDFEAEMVVRILCGVREVTEEHGYFLKLLQVPYEKETLASVLAQCAEQRLSGVVAISLTTDALDLLRRETANYNIAVALLDDVPEQNWALGMACDDEPGIRETVAHLVREGHQHLALLSGPSNSSVAGLREEIFRRVIEDEHALSLPITHRAHGDWWDLKINEPLIRVLLNTQPRPTALLCASDWMAMAALHVSRAMGLDVPRDVSVIGFSDLSLAHFSDPSLSTIHQPFREMGRQAMTRLMKNIEDEAYETADPESLKLKTHLVLRNSTGPCPSKK